MIKLCKTGLKDRAAGRLCMFFFQIFKFFFNIRPGWKEKKYLTFLWLIQTCFPINMWYWWKKQNGYIVTIANINSHERDYDVLQWLLEKAVSGQVYRTLLYSVTVTSFDHLSLNLVMSTMWRLNNRNVIPNCIEKSFI